MTASLEPSQEISQVASRSPEVIEWTACGRSIAGERESGDLHVAAPFAGGALVGLIDGLGHGQDAALASRRAAGVLGRDPALPVQSLVEACHQGLRGTRGGVLSLASIDARCNVMTWIGVGNVEAVLVRAEPGGLSARNHLIPRNGVVGYQLPPLRAMTTSIRPADILVFASDGLRHGFAAEPLDGRSLEAYAAHLLDAFGKSDDDALVLVVRYLGTAS